MSAAAPSPVVVDTNIVSYLFKGDTRADRYRPHLVGSWPVISFMTLAELDFWAEIHGWDQGRRDAMETFLAGYATHWPQ